MNKAKLFLAFLGVVSITGGAIAAKYGGQVFYITFYFDMPAAITLSTATITSTGEFLPIYYYTKIPGGKCYYYAIFSFVS